MIKKIILLAFVAVIVFGIYLAFTNSIWNGKDKFSYFTLTQNSDIVVTVLDPRLSEITKITIPADTEVNVSRDYGLLRIKNVWQMGINEKVGGSLLAQTISKNFLFPVKYWWNSDETNLGRIDKFRISLFVKRVKSVNVNEIDMGKNSYLKKVKLADGESGYQLQGPMSPRLTAFFEDSFLSDKNIRIKITDHSGKVGLTDNLGLLLEVIGGKVVSVEKKDVDKDLDCLVGGTNLKAIENVTDLYGCTLSKDKSNFDLEVKIGQKFASRF